MLSCPFLRLARRLSCAAVAAAFATSATAQPAGPTNVHGTATVQAPVGASTETLVLIQNGAGNRSVTDWQSFSIPGGTTTRFVQPSTDSLSINRVTGNNASAIFGTLRSNGRLVLVNPAGITVGAGALVDTAGFTASTLGMTRTDAVNGTLRFGGPGALDDFGGATPQRITVDGTILGTGGDVVLVAPKVDVGRDALVQSVGGDVILAAGRTVGLTGRGIENIVLEVRAPDDEAVNLGTLRGDSVAIFAGQLRHRGLIQAHSATASGGKVVLNARTRAEIEGRIEASTALRGGTVDAFAGDRLELKGAAVIDVSHATAGGDILLASGDRLEGDRGVVLRVEATLSGTAGTVRFIGPDQDFRGSVVPSTATGSSGGSGGSGGSGSDDDDDNDDDDDDSSGSGNSGNSGNGGNGGNGGNSGNGGNGGNGGKSGKSGKSGSAGNASSNAREPEPARPQEVQAALRQTETETGSYLDQPVAAAGSGPEDRYKRKVVVDAVSCSVTR